MNRQQERFTRAFPLLLGFPEKLCSGVFFTENAHEGCNVELHPQGKCSNWNEF